MSARSCNKSGSKLLVLMPAKEDTTHPIVDEHSYGANEYISLFAVIARRKEVVGFTLNQFKRARERELEVFFVIWSTQNSMQRPYYVCPWMDNTGGLCQYDKILKIRSESALLTGKFRGCIVAFNRVFFIAS